MIRWRRRRRSTVSRSTYREPRRHGCAIEDNSPPGINDIATQIHASENDGAEHVFFVAKRVVSPGEKSRLARIHGTGPVVRAEDYRRRVVAVGIIRGGQDEGRGDNPRDGDKVSHQVPLAVEKVGERRPEERGYDARGGDAGRVVVELRDSVLVFWVALHVQG